MSFILSAGLGRPADAAAAVLYQYFAAAANQTAAQLALGCAPPAERARKRLCAL